MERKIHRHSVHTENFKRVFVLNGTNEICKKIRRMICKPIVVQISAIEAEPKNTVPKRRR